MKWILLFLNLCVWPFMAHAGGPVEKDPVSYINYTQNKGQWESNVLYRAEFRGGVLFLEQNAFTYLFYPKAGIRQFHAHGKSDETDASAGSTMFHAVRMEFSGANPQAAIQAGESNTFYENYYLGNDPSKWAHSVQSFRHVNYQELYPGITLKSFGRGNNIRYDFVVAPQADVSAIKLTFTGQDKLFLREGKLVLLTSGGEVIQEAPVAYQDINGQRHVVKCQYILTDNSVGISAGHYNKNEPLIIDPTLVFATYTGSTADNFGMTATYDIAGNGYTAGICFHPGYPVTPGAFQPAYAGGGSISNPSFDISISKFNPGGTALLFSTYLGGTNLESPHSIVVDNNYNLIVFGRSASVNFPVTSGAYDNTNNGGYDLIVTKFNSTGTALMASTYLGGTQSDGVNVNAAENIIGGLKYNYADDGRGGVLVDNQNNVYIASCTMSTDFPTTPGCLQPANAGGQDGCVFKMNPTLSSLIYSTYLGGSANDAAYNIALDTKKRLYVTGGTESPDFPTTAGVLHPNYMGNIDGFITHLSTSGNTILRSGYIGTPDYDQSYFVQTDRFNNVYLYGQSQGAYPITPGVFANQNSGQFIHEMDSSLSVTVFSTEFGSGRTTPDIAPSAFLVDNCQNIYCSGWGGTLGGYNVATSSTFGMTTTTNAYQPITDGQDFYFIVLAKNAASILYGSYFGGNLSAEHVDGGTSRFDKAGIVYQAICESCGGHDDMPTTPGAWSSTNNSSNCNNALVKFKFDILQTVAQLSTNPQTTTGCAPFAVQFVNNSVNAIHYKWLFGDNTMSTATNPSHTYTQPGSYTVTLVATDSSTCNMVDTTYITITVNLPLSLSPTVPIDICKGDSVTLDINLPNNGAYTYTWSPANTLSNASVTTPTAWPSQSTEYIVSITDSMCHSVILDSISVHVHGGLTHIVEDPAHLCIDDTVKLSANAVFSSYNWSTGQHVPEINITTPGLYTLNTVDNFGCTGFDSIRIGNYTHVPITTYSVALCKGQSIKLETTEGDDYTYSWSPANHLDDAGIYNPNASPETNTQYTVSVYNGPCLTTGVYTVVVHPIPALSARPGYTMLLPGESVQLQATADSTCYWYPGYALSCTSCYNPVSGPDSNTVYYVSTVNHFGCINTSSVVVNVEPTFYVPNSFTPNGNGLNDLFRPVFTGYTELDVYIFNRWGELLYHYNTLDGGWDGTFKGGKCEMGVYVYKITAKDWRNHVIERVGSVTLVR
ncbi:MAG: gliding motility-associated C-terminal domain-containing protein [Bacteroidetes bacterium]|nr:gliding motility-associated C-terminal domain-containing protein [Bacteroidota bacterium]